jgi:hypothetical protein
LTRDPRRFYVYAFLRSRDSANGPKYSPYYIGKGSRGRAFIKANRPIPAPTDKSFIVFIQEGLTEEEAFALEKYCIGFYGRIDKQAGMLHNRTDGGDGTSGAIVSVERRAKMAVVCRKARQREGRWRGENNPKFGGDAVRGELNPMWGKEHSEETRQKISERNKIHYNKPENKIKNKLKAQKYLYELIDPAGKVYITENLWEFSKQYNLTNASLSKVVHGKALHHKKWTGRIIEQLR